MRSCPETTNLSRLGVLYCLIWPSCGTASSEVSAPTNRRLHAWCTYRKCCDHQPRHTQSRIAKGACYPPLVFYFCFLHTSAKIYSSPTPLLRAAHSVRIYIRASQVLTAVSTRNLTRTTGKDSMQH